MAINKDKVRDAAQKYLQKGQIDKAIREYQRLVEDDPKDVRSLLKLGDLQTRANDNVSATQAYSKVAQFYTEQGFFLKAVAVYKQILKLDPNLVDVNMKLAELYHQLGLLSDASNQYRQLSQLLESQGKVQEGIAVLKKMAELDPENVASRVKLADLYAKQNMVEEARSEYRKAAAFLKQHHRVDDYIKVAELIVSFDANDLETTRELANLYIQKGDTRRALAKLQISFKANPKDVGTLTLLASAFFDLGQTQKTVSVYRELGRIHRDAGDMTQLRAVMRKILDLAPDDAEAKEALAGEADKRTTLGRIVPAQRSVTPAAQEVREVARLPEANEPDEDISVDTDDMTEEPEPDAAPAAAAVVPNDDQETIGRLLVETDIYNKFGLRSKAIEHIRKIFAIDPEHREAQEKLKNLLVEAGDAPAAVAHLLTMARAAQTRGDLDRARDDLEELLGLDPSNQDARDLLASVAPDAALVGVHIELEDEPDFNADASEAADVPSVVREGAPHGLNLSYEPSADAAGIDLDAEEPSLGELDLAETPAVAASSPTPTPTRSAPRSAPNSPAASSATPSSAATLAAAKSKPAPRSAAVEELDALLASAVPKRTSPAAAKPEAPAPAAAPPRIEPKPTAAPRPEPRPDPVASTPTSTSASTDVDLSDEIEEVQFYLQQGLEDEAKDALANLLLAHPDHPELKALQAQLQAPPAPAPAALPSDDAEPEPETVQLGNLATELASELDEAGGADDLQVSFADVFDEFKKGVAEQVDDSDFETHYNLGIAYKEMGLLDDAVRQFEHAQRSPQRQIDSLTMVGLCELERGDTNAALEVFMRGLNAKNVTPIEALALRYEIGRAYETMGRFGDALKFYEKVHSMDARFRDVALRLQEAQQHHAAGDAGDVSSSELDQLLEDTNAEKAAQKGGKISYL